MKLFRHSKTEKAERPVILVVEDDADMLRFISLKLGKAYEVQTAVNGREGLGVAMDQIPDLVVSDLMMPGMDGLEMCQKLKSNPMTSHIPVVLLTAKDTVENQIEGLETGADDYVTKPFVMELLKVRIENLLKSRQLLRAQFKREYVAGEQPDFFKNDGDRIFLEKALLVLRKKSDMPDFNNEEFAHEMGLGLRSLHRKLKAVSDQTPSAFTNEFRMKRAAELLAASSHNITEIGFMVGIEEPSSFSRMFKNRFGMAPSDYRRTYSTSG